MSRATLLLVGPLAAGLLLAMPARADGQVTGTISLAAAHDGATTTKMGENPDVQSGLDLVTFTANYTVTNLAQGTAHIELDFCTPASLIQLVSTGGQAPLSSCRDGSGAAGTRATTSIVAGSSQGTTGFFSVNSYTAYGITPEGTHWVVPARLVLDSNPPVTIANDSVTLIVHARPSPVLVKQFASVITATQPGGSAPGYNVTWRLAPSDEVFGYGELYYAGTTTIHDAVPTGSVYVGGTQGPVNTGFNVLSDPAYRALHLNSAFTLTPAGAAPSAVTDVVMTIDNLATHTTSVAPSGLVTIWYPVGTTTASNTATATFPDGQTRSSTASVYLGAGAGSISKQHLCPTVFPGQQFTQYSSLTALSPGATSNLECAWDPSAPIQFQVAASSTQPAGAPSPGAAMPMLNPVITDVLPTNLVLLALDGVYAASDTLAQHNLGSQWTISGSSDSNCSATSGSYSVLSLPATPASLSGVRCLRHSYAGFTSAVLLRYAAVLDSFDRATLNASPGSYLWVTNNAFLKGDQLPTVSTSLVSTFWNSHQPRIKLFNASASVGQDFTILGVVPFSISDLVNNYLGFTDLTFSGTLPIELDLTAAPYLDPGTNPPVNDLGNAVPLDCTFTPQDRTALPVKLAAWRCTVHGHIPSFTQDPFTDPGCSAPDYCSSHGNTDPWNRFFFLLPERVVSGTQGQQVSAPNQVWSNAGTVGTSGVTAKGSSESNPVTANYEVSIGGTSQLTVRKSTTSISVETGKTIDYTIDYANTGTITTTGTHVYEFFGRNPATGHTLSADYSAQGCTASDFPTLVSVTHQGGQPASLVEYTTDAVPTAGSFTNWTATAPGNLGTVTGLRFTLNSAFSPVVGEYSPVDQPGTEVIRLQAPNDVNQKLCNMAGIGADGFNVAASLAVGGAVPITPVCGNPMGCDPVVHPGPPQTVFASASCGPASVTLDGSSSLNAVAFSWSENGTLLSSQASFTTSLAFGTHNLVLTVTNSFGVSVSGTVSVKVVDGAPQITCPASVQAPLDSSCVPHYSFTPPTTDSCDPNPAVSCSSPALTPGSTVNATCTATNSSGLTASCTVPITAGTTGCAPISNPAASSQVSVGPACSPGQISLDGSNSINAVSYAWSENGVVFSNSQFLTQPFPFGTHVITLTVENALHVSASATVTARVVETDPPVLTCPGPITVAIDKNTCLGTYTVVPTVSDSCDPSVSGAGVTVSCPLFPLHAGDNDNIMCTATNSSGLSVTCFAQVNGGDALGSSQLTLSPVTGAAGTGGAVCNYAPITIPFTLTAGCNSPTDFQAPTFTASYLDAGGHPQALGVTSSIMTQDSQTITGVLTLVGTSSLVVDSQITIIGAGATGTLLATAEEPFQVQQCACTDSFTLGNPTFGQSAGHGFCGGFYLNFPFNLTPACGAATDPGTTFQVSYVNSSNATVTISSVTGSFDLDYSTYRYLDTGNVNWILPADASGSVVFTVTAVGSTGSILGTTTTTQQLDQACATAACVPDGMVLFEDLWPKNGDLDFNDQSIAYNYQFLLDPNQNVTTMQATFNVLSIGATIHNGLYLHLPGLPANTPVTMTLTNSADSNSQTLHAVTGERDLIIPLVNDTRSLFGNQGGFINTDVSLPSVQGTALFLLVTFTTPIAPTVLDISKAPFDLFIAHSGDYGHQIHQAQYPRSDRMGPGLIGTFDDGTGSGAYFVNKSGLPFALNLPVSSAWPQERVSIENVYPDLVTFAQSGGTAGQFWYQNMVPDQAYLAAANGTVPPPPLAAPNPLTGLGGSCSTPGFGGGVNIGGSGDSHNHQTQSSGN